MAGGIIVFVCLRAVIMTTINVIAVFVFVFRCVFEVAPPSKLTFVLVDRAV